MIHLVARRDGVRLATVHGPGKKVGLRDAQWQSAARLVAAILGRDDLICLLNVYIDEHRTDSVFSVRLHYINVTSMP